MAAVPQLIDSWPADETVRQQPPAAAQFGGWLAETVRQFSSLTSEEQTVTLNQLISCCGSEQLWHLQQKLPDFLYRDFVCLLPPEITEAILSYLSPQALLTASNVSKQWNKKIGEMTLLWRAKGRLLGCYLPPIDQPDQQTQGYKQICIQGLRVRNYMSGGRAWEQESLVNLVRPPGRFSALHHHRGHIAAGSADSSPVAGAEVPESVVIWAVAASRVDVSFPVSGSVSCLKLHFPLLVVCGHFDGSLSSHLVSRDEGEGREPGHLLQKYRLHTAPVLSLDFDLDEDILVSGAADSCSKLWQLSSGQLLRTLPPHGHWVLSTIFTSCDRQTMSQYRGRHVLLTMTRDDIKMFTWYPDRSVEGDSVAGMIRNLDLQDIPQDGPRLKDVSTADLFVPLKSVTEAIQSFFFTPGLHFDGSRISFVRQMPMFDTQTIGDADIVTIDGSTGRTVQNVHVNQKIRKLLAIGKRFAVILLPYVDSKYKNLAVVDLVRREIVGGGTVPHSRASTPDFSQVSIGDTSWLDGLSSNSTTGLVACLALADSSIQTVTWDEHRDQDAKRTEGSPSRRGLYVTGMAFY